MPIPDFTIDGILPPFIGSTGPGGASNDMTPYIVTAEEVAIRFGTTENRRDILRKWLNFRADLRTAGFVRGFQWIDGSFVENKEPQDIDVMSFTYSPTIPTDPAARAAWLALINPLFSRAPVKAKYKVDLFPIDLTGSPEILVDATRYYGALFSHRRGDNLWKGMLSVRLEDVADDQAALAAIAPPAVVGVVGAAP
jgi:hypothetical protein